MDVRDPRDEREVGEEDSNLDQALDRGLGKGVVVLAGDDARREKRQQEEHADPDQERESQHEGDRALAELDVVLLCLDARAPDEPARPDDQRLVEDDEAADEGQLGPRGAMESGTESLCSVDDAAVGVAEGDGNRVATAHEDALDQRLSAVGVPGHGGESSG